MSLCPMHYATNPCALCEMHSKEPVTFLQSGAIASPANTLKQLMADAARYRWIAEQATAGDWGHHFGWILHLEIKGAPSIESLDDAIDAARSSATPERSA